MSLPVWDKIHHFTMCSFSQVHPCQLYNKNCGHILIISPQGYWSSSSFSSALFAGYFKGLSKSSASTVAPLNFSIIFLWPPALNLSYSWFLSRFSRTKLWPIAPAAIFPPPVPTQPLYHTSVTSLSSPPWPLTSSTTEMPFFMQFTKECTSFHTSFLTTHLPLLTGTLTSLPAPVHCHSDKAKHC